MREAALKLVLFVIAILGIVLIASLIAAVNFAGATHVPAHVAGKVTTCSEGLSWDANTEADMANYSVYLGSESGVYNLPVSAPHLPSQRIVFPCADAGATLEGQYYFVVSAKDTAGNESAITAEFPFFLDRIPETPSGLDVN